MGEFAWGGAANTIFWIDPKEKMFVIWMTQVSAPPHTTRRLALLGRPGPAAAASTTIAAAACTPARPCTCCIVLRRRRLLLLLLLLLIEYYFCYMHNRTYNTMCEYNT